MKNKLYIHEIEKNVCQKYGGKECRRKLLCFIDESL